MPATEPDIVLSEIAAGVAVVTLNRPAARNALSGGLIGRLRETLAEHDADPEVGAIVLTGSDPAFCAGLDLGELAAPRDKDRRPEPNEELGRYPWPPLRTPVIGAINGVAATGGLELALHCDFLIGSVRARFVDTHVRFGLMPIWRMSVLLPLIAGRGMALRMALTGGFLDAPTALRVGLLTEMTEHEDLLPRAFEVAGTIARTRSASVSAMLESYREVEGELLGAGHEVELANANNWLATGFDRAAVSRRRDAD